LDTTLIIHKAAIIAYERRITGTLRYKTPSTLRTGRRNSSIDKGKTFFSSPSKLIFSFEVSDKRRLYSIKKTDHVKADIATVSGKVDKD